MIFQPKLAHLILEGAKTQTRRIVGSDDDVSRYKLGKAYALERPRHLDDLTMEERRRVDEGTVSRQRYRETVGRILITDVRTEDLCELTLQDAKAEGFRSRAAFADYWMRLHDRDWPIMTEQNCAHCDEQHIIEVHCGRCHGRGVLISEDILTGPASLDRPCEECDSTGRVWIECPHCDMGVVTAEATPTEADILDRFTVRHGHRRVWVLTFQLANTDQRRLLGKTVGYASLTPAHLANAGEAITAEEQARIVARAGMETEQWLALEEVQRERMGLDQRLAAVLAAADDGGVDVRRNEARIRQAIQQLEGKVRRLAA